MTDNASSAFTRCRGVKDICIYQLLDPTVLATIGRKLISLDLWAPSEKVIEGNVEKWVEEDGEAQG
jgi:hypothetical protein